MPGPNEKRFAKDVARQLDRRRTRRRTLLLLVLLGAVALAASYLTCGRGWGLLGKGAGSGAGSGAQTTADPRPKRCAIRVTKAGITVGGVHMTRAKAVAACKATTGADVVITGDARQGDWEELRAALEAANVPVFTKQR